MSGLETRGSGTGSLLVEGRDKTKGKGVEFPIPKGTVGSVGGRIGLEGDFAVEIELPDPRGGKFTSSSNE